MSLVLPKGPREGYYVLPPHPPKDFWFPEVSNECLEVHKYILAGGTPSTDDWILYCRERGASDLFFLGSTVLGNDWLEWELHGRLAWAWTAPNGTRVNGRIWDRFRAAIIPRGHLKTTLLTQYYCIFRIIRDPSIRILIFTAHEGLAADIVSFIKGVFEGQGLHGELFKQCYGHLTPTMDMIREAAKTRQSGVKWTSTEFTVVRDPNKHKQFMEPTVRGKGVDSKITGGHYPLHVVDDLVGEELGRAQMDKTIRRYDNLTPLYDSLKTGEQRFVGTPWAFHDPTSYIERHWPHAIVARIPWKQKDESLIFSKCDKAEAERIFKRNPWFAACQYDVWPRDENKIGFRREWFRYFRFQAGNMIPLDRDGKEIKRVPLASCNIFILSDPTTGREEAAKTSTDLNAPVSLSRDFSSWVVLAVTAEHEKFVLYAQRWRCNADEYVARTFELISIWHPRFFGIETVAAQYLYVPIFRNEFRRGRPSFQIVPWPGGSASKPARIRALVPDYANGLIWHREADSPDITAGIQALENELLDYPTAEYDDISDALSASMQICYAPGASGPPAKVIQLEREKTQRERLEKLDPGSRKEYTRILRMTQGGRAFDKLFEEAAV